MPRPASSLSTKFVGHLKHLEKTRSKMERLIDENLLVRRDVEQVYSGLFIEAMTSFEQLIEDLFLGLLTSRLNCTVRNVVPRVVFNSDLIARDVVYGGRNYVDWLPYKQHTEKRAHAFLRNGLPFTSLDNADYKQLEELSQIRNAIAHKSQHSKRVFQTHVIRGLALTSIEKTPAGYLRNIVRISPAQTTYEMLAIEMSLIAKKLCA